LHNSFICKQLQDVQSHGVDIKKHIVCISWEFGGLTEHLSLVD